MEGYVSPLSIFSHHGLTGTQQKFMLTMKLPLKKQYLHPHSASLKEGHKVVAAVLQSEQSLHYYLRLSLAKNICSNIEI